MNMSPVWSVMKSPVPPKVAGAAPLPEATVTITSTAEASSEEVAVNAAVALTV